MTIKDIANAVGVSDATVSRVLAAKHGRFSPATRDCVLKAAREMGYRVNMAPVAMRRKSFGTYALVVSEVADGRSTVPDQLLRGACDALEAMGMHLSVVTLPDAKLTDETYVPRILREWAADGLLINYNKHLPPRMSELIDEYGIPAVWVNLKTPLHAVYPDDVGAGRDVTRRLLALGHRRILFVNSFTSPDNRHYSDVDRRDGYLQAMLEAGLHPDVVEQPALAGRSPADVCLEKFRLADRPTACISYSHEQAAALLPAFWSYGLAVPEDVSLVTFDDFSHQLCLPNGHLRCDSLKIPSYDVGRCAVEMLRDQIGDGQVRPSIAVPFQHQPGKTLGPPRRRVP